MSKDESINGIINSVEFPAVADGGITTDVNKKNPPQPAVNEGRKKKRGAFSLLKSAVFMLRKSQNKKFAKSDKSKVDSSKGNWQKIVGSIRPLHLQEDNSPPPSNPSLSISTSVERFDGLIRPASPYSSVASSSASPISGGTMSQYASANNLQELDEEAGYDSDKVFDSLAGDEMIDAKAEEFIKQFYQQMRHQNLKN
ncbi:uncharacterized protein LOC111394516 [Olea europaea var. sylvestris]|uniref:Uncharacterized protein n=1 Tax=Olea europaea subsp. europaea TaxID=158383 RepID=A0A8S0RZL1_OLEEU|nr:uncharacterized protein LOC111394516 [Olea europaea var. sylvestris]CAA2985576.1 Hypothetical predicted protein [Olea europaea subsp. europaea]